MTRPENNQPGTAAFADAREYRAELFRLETIRLKFYFQSETVDTRGCIRTTNRFLPAAEEVGRLLDRKIEGWVPGNDLRIMQAWDEYFRRRNKATPAGITGPGEKLCLALGLREFGRSAAAMSLLAETDGDYRAVFQFLQGKVEMLFPTPELCAKVFFHQQKEHAAELYREAETEMAALALLFPALAESANPYREQMIPDRRLTSVLLGGAAYFPHYLDIRAADGDLPPQYFREREHARLESYLRGDLGGLVYLYGEKGAGKKHFIRHFCREKEWGVIFCRLSRAGMEEQPPGPKHRQALRTALREAVFRRAALAVSDLQAYSPEQQKRLLGLLRRETAEKCPAVFMLTDEESPLPGADRLLALELPPLDERQRRRIWEHYGGEAAWTDDAVPTALANTFALSPGRIVTALGTARRRAGSADGPLDRELLYSACYGLAEHKLAEKAKRVKTDFRWDDLKLHASDKAVLRDLCNRVKNKHIVMADWGFAAKLPYGGGVSAVFAGPPGTGKTMAAQVTANELGMELYQIDLSQVVDKYIGETEKNIRLIFKEARKSNSILFFDEADALFGKRVEASGANERFANIESSLLLQCMEEYSGISLLATNNYSAVDPAFVRRFKYLVNFRMPDAALRREIWESVFPAAVPLSDELDFPWLAGQFTLTGAYIKNIALAAAFYAAEEGARVGMVHLLRGLKREMTKDGRMLEQAQLGSYGYLFSEL